LQFVEATRWRSLAQTEPAIRTKGSHHFLRHRNDPSRQTVVPVHRKVGVIASSAATKQSRSALQIPVKIAPFGIEVINKVDLLLP
jgi:hypothetical protein